MLLGKSMKEYEKFLKKTERPQDKLIYNDFKNGMTVEEISSKYNISPRGIMFKIRKQRDLEEFQSI